MNTMEDMWQVIVANGCPDQSNLMSLFYAGATMALSSVASAEDPGERIKELLEQIREETEEQLNGT